MSNNMGIVLEINFEKQELYINQEWLSFDSNQGVNQELLGKIIRYSINDKHQVMKIEHIEKRLQEIKGKIQSMNLGIPRISMHVKGKLVHFYIPNHVYQLNGDRLNPGDFVQFFYYEQEIKLHNSLYYVISHFKEEKRQEINFPQSISKDLKEALKHLLEAEYYVFLDLEFSLGGPEYRGKNFTPEIIQVGLIITNANGQILEKFSSYIKPTIFPNLTDKTQEFLKISKQVVANGITYMQFYDFINDIKARYQPLFVVWGVSDGFVLNKSSTLNQVEPLFEPNQLIDLQRIHRQYFEIGQDIGLYNALRSYGFFMGIQIHDALLDALVLHHIFCQFKENIEQNQEFPFKQNYQTILENR